jgi:hypothetical protein
MRNKITKAMRERAILICEIAASSPGGDHPYAYADIERNLGVDDNDDLAYKAWSVCAPVDVGNHKPGRYWSPERDAEAAALLREGWCPGDEVVRR